MHYRLHICIFSLFFRLFYVRESVFHICLLFFFIFSCTLLLFCCDGFCCRRHWDERTKLKRNFNIVYLAMALHLQTQNHNNNNTVRYFLSSHFVSVCIIIIMFFFCFLAIPTFVCSKTLFLASPLNGVLLCSVH